MPSPIEVVVADDNRDAADTLVELLDAIGHPAIAAYDGEQAVRACAEFNPALVILDVEMPNVNGCEAAERIRSAGPPPDVLASLSGLRDHEEPMRSQGSVFDVRLAKPIRMAELAKLLDRALPAKN